MITENDIDNWFTHHPPTHEEVVAYTQTRQEAKKLARTIFYLTPSGPDQTAAIRKVREAVMTANAAIACKSPTT